MHQFRKLKVWQKAMSFVSNVYAVSNKYPKYELFGLTDQIRRAATSIALNIAEGSGAGSDIEFIRFLRISLRSLYEVITASEIALQLTYCQKSVHEDLVAKANEIGAMLNSLIKYLKTSNNQRLKSND